MDPRRYQRLRALVHGAGSLPAAERAAWLAGAAGDDPALVQEALALLAEARTTTDLVPAVRAPAEDEAWPAGTRLGPYRLERVLGRGGMGVVYAGVRAEDGADGPPVAVKVILPHLVSTSGARERFLREARLGLAIDHPHVVRTLDVGEGGALLPAAPGAPPPPAQAPRLYLAMERLQGRTLRQMLEELGTLPEALVRAVAREAAEGLAAMHAAGAVHRDVKPENLFLAEDRRLRLMDLGVAKSTRGGTTLTVDGLFVGSPAYASPEQALGQPVGPAADLYALGCVLYELLCGRPPFDALEPLALLRAHADAAPEPVAERCPEVSPFLAALVGRLLEKDPARRFLSARALAQALEEGEAGRWWASERAASERAASSERAGARRRPAGPPPGRLRRLALVGRGPEVEALRRALRALEAGHGGVVLIEGEAGVGKTRLVEELPALLAGDGAPALARLTLAEAALDGGLGALLLAQAASGPEAPSLAQRLGVASPVAEAFAAHLGRRTPPPGLEPLSPTAVEVLTSRVGRRLAEERPRLWVVEDLHAAGPEQRRLVAALARAGEDAPLLLVLTSRPGLDAETRAALTALGSFQHLPLARLAPEDVATLLGLAVEDRALGQRLQRELGARLDGVPLFVLETVRHLERAGQLARGPSGAYEAHADLRGVEIPAALRDLVEARLAALGPAERALLELAAVEGAEFEPALLARARGRPLLEVLEDLGRIERRHGLLRSGPSRVRFDHPLVREVLYQGLPQALRAALHDGLADALAATGAAGPAAGAPAAPAEADAVVRLAAHRLSGAAPAAAGAVVEQALALLARAQRGPERLDLLARALEVPGLVTGPAAVDQRVEVSALAMGLRRRGQARAAAEAALALALREGWRREAARAAHQLGWVALRTADYEAARSCAQSARTLAEEAGDDALANRALRLLGHVCWMRGEHAEARRLCEQVLAHAAWLPDPSFAAQARATLGILLQEQGRLVEAETHQRAALSILRATGDQRSLGSLLGDLANTLLDAGRMGEAAALYAEAQAELRRAGVLDSDGTLLINQGELALRSGELERARTLYLEARELSREAGAVREEAYAIHGLGVVAAWSGDPEAARRHLEAALTLRRRIGNQPALLETLMQLGVLDVEAGRVAEARARLDEAARLAEAVDDLSAATVARLWAAVGAGGDPEAARRAFLGAREVLRSDAALEGRWLLLRLFHDPEDRRVALALVAEQEARVAPASREAFRRHVPYVRGVLEAGR